ncbi:unnamed protein product [Hyaloperonospora brassicae]|uniref:Protein kinase domain-containing protein n=1 Tax=Hyaloperonospora brassicae TaxID=162125 RepID=A0AAV0TH93_HYABA|nr:unnamed protein product [Hyaloperonospora brassicae]
MAGTDKLSSQSTTAAKVETHRAFVSTYLLMKEIGQGSFSIVHRAVNRRTGIVCAVKCCESSQALRQEEQLLHSLSHPNVVSLEGVYERDKNVHYVVMDYMKDGDLCDLLIQEQHLPESTARGIIRQVAEALAYLHGRCVLHRDIKPENILIHGDMVKIADFGLAKQLVQQTAMLTHGCGTLEYAAPEVLCSRPYGLKSDVFSLGIVLYVLLFGAFPFSIDSTAALQRIHHFPKRVDVRNMRCLDDQPNVHWQTVSPLAQDVLQKMLKTSDLERISAQDLLDHPWFTGADTNMLASVNSNLKASELSRVEDCEAMGFAELLSRGFPVVKHGHERSTTRTTSLSLNFVDLCVSWTARKNPMPTGAATDSNGNATGCRTKQRRTIPLREINEIREGHSARAFSPFESVSPVIPSELCLSIICARRTLDLQVEYQSQRDFLVRGLRRLLAFET